METFQTKTVLGDDGQLLLKVPCKLPPGPIEVMVVMAPGKHEVHWRDLYGLGKEIWQGTDAQQYVNDLRDEWER